ncbi:MAG: HAMP domain-containing protein [Tardiphaga sp.]|uniref:methyl-accepting chemotaxis protein n=1 Tax=Tardiphaga sp. TaxID=1926292 RepID=UPI0019833FCA|nr:methyl-accepting chemotaxis protein [Tardiphaga sp.]MBC7584481.1 HAMP domain-containing protein [Tardiphaga sp.]
MFRLNSISSKLAIVFAMILPILVWQLGKDTVQSLRSHDDMKLLDRQNAAANTLIAGAYEILLERLATNNALLAEQPASSDVLSAIEKNRSVAVSKISAAYADLSALEFPDKAALLGDLKAAIDKANSYRAKADAAMKQAKAGRDADTVKNLFVSLSDLSAVSQKVWGGVLSNTSAYDPELGRLSNLRMLAWNLREIAGIERSHIAAAIPSKSAIPADKLTAIGENRAQIALMWKFVQAGLKANEHPAITKGVQLAKEGYFAGFQPLADQMRKVSAEGAAYPMAQQQWVDTTTPQLFTLLEVMYGAGVASEAHTAAAQGTALQSLIISLVLLGMGLAALITAVLIVTRSVVRPLKKLTDAMHDLAGGNFSVVLPGLGRKDEIGDMAQAVETFKVKVEEKARHEAEAQMKQDQVAAKQRKADMIKLADDFEDAIGEIIETVSSASTELEASASTLTSTAERAQQLTTIVAAASEKASTNVQSVASATEEMTSSVNEISRQVQDSARIANEAVDQARETNDRVGELSKAAARIGDVVELINTIAGQTNLLALNATIEAARAGEAGRGFAVVASEVKALAEQTAKATGEIGQQITGIQSATQDSVNAIKEISGTIERLSEISSTIAAAVEEQGTATQVISRNVQQAAQGTMQVSSNIAGVERGASETGSASSQVLSAAQSLSTESNRLKLEVGKFLNSVRAA